MKYTHHRVDGSKCKSKWKWFIFFAQNTNKHIDIQTEAHRFKTDQVQVYFIKCLKLSSEYCKRSGKMNTAPFFGAEYIVKIKYVVNLSWFSLPFHQHDNYYQLFGFHSIFKYDEKYEISIKRNYSLGKNAFFQLGSLKKLICFYYFIGTLSRELRMFAIFGWFMSF